MSNVDKTVPVWEKYSLNIPEAAEYYGIGEKRLRQIANENVGADFILEINGENNVHFILAKRVSCDIINTTETVFQVK